MTKHKRNVTVLMLLDNTFMSDARVEKEAKALLTNGFKVIVACVRDNDSKMKEVRNGIEIHRIIPSEFISPLRFGHKNMIRQLVTDLSQFHFDIIHCHDFHMLRIGVELNKKKKSSKLVYDAHEYLKGWPYYKTANGVLNKLKGKIVWNYFLRQERKNIKEADYVITVTSGISKRLKSDHRLSYNPTVIGNPPPNTSVQQDKSYFRELFGLNENSIILVHSGTIYQSDKQLHQLFKIVKETKDLILVMMGNRPRFYEVKEWANQNPELKNKIFFHDYYPEQEKNIKCIANGDIGLMHVRDEWVAHRITYSNRFVEYLMAELPVVATHQEFAKEINEQFNCCEFYSENDEIELQHAIEQIICDLKKHQLNAILAKSKISWESESLKFIEFYSSINA